MQRRWLNLICGTLAISAGLWAADPVGRKLEAEPGEIQVRFPSGAEEYRGDLDRGRRNIPLHGEGRRSRRTADFG